MFLKSVCSFKILFNLFFFTSLRISKSFKTEYCFRYLIFFKSLFISKYYYDYDQKRVRQSFR